MVTCSTEVRPRPASGVLRYGYAGLQRGHAVTIPAGGVLYFLCRPSTRWRLLLVTPSSLGHFTQVCPSPHPARTCLVANDDRPAASHALPSIDRRFLSHSFPHGLASGLREPAEKYRGTNGSSFRASLKGKSLVLVITVLFSIPRQTPTAANGDREKELRKE